MLVGEWPGDNGKVIAGMGGMILSQVTFVPAFWGRVSGGFPCSFLGGGGQFGVALSSCIWGTGGMSLLPQQILLL